MIYDDIKKMCMDDLITLSDHINSEIHNRNANLSVEKMQEANSIHMYYQETFSMGPHMANTLDPGDIGVNSSGWAITGEIHEDWFTWVNEFSATHENGKWWVRGDFESIVEASSKEAYDDFVKHHPPHEWDYWDI